MTQRTTRQVSTAWWRPDREAPPDRPRPLVLSPAAWLKWQYLCHAGPTEAAGFGLSAADDPLYLEDVLVVRQHASAVSVAMDDAAVADLFDRMADLGVPPARFARVWLHTHPGSSAAPSPTDEETFGRAFGGCDWAVMAILSRAGRTYARARFAAGPGGSVELPVAVDWAAWPEAMSDPDAPLAGRFAAWRAEYAALVEDDEFLPPSAEGFDDAFGGFPPRDHF